MESDYLGYDEYHSLRNRWPTEPGRYAVIDCGNKASGECDFDGWYWGTPDMKQTSRLLGLHYCVTHWKPL